MATINSGNSTTLYSTTQTTTSVNTASNLPQDKVNDTNFTTLYSNTSAAATGGGTSGNLLVSGNLRVLGTSDLEGAVTIGNSYILPTSDGTANQVITTDGAGNLTFQNVTSLNSYAIQADTATGGANLTLVGTSSTDSVKFASGTNITVSRTDANTITISTVADNIPDGTAQGQVLYWDGTAWTANNNITSASANDRFRLIYKNSTAGVSSGLFLRKDFGATPYTTNDGTALSFQLDSDSQVTNQIATIAAVWDATAPSIALTTNINNNTTGPFVSVANFTSALATLPKDLTMNGEVLKINADSTAADSYIYLKGTSVFVKYNNTTDFIEMPRTAIDNVCIDNNTIFTSTGDLTLTSTGGTTLINNNLNVDSGTLYVNATTNRVGINNVSPNFTLDVGGDAYINSNLTVHGSTTLGNNYISDRTDIVGQFDVSNNSISNLFVDRNTGYVGINDNTPSYQLDVNGDTNITGDIYVSGVHLDLSTPVHQGQLLYVSNDATPTITNSNVVIANNSSYRPTFQYDNSTAGVSSGIFTRKNFGATPFTTGDGTAVSFQIDSDSQALQQIATISASYDASAPVITLATNANANTTGPFISAASFSSAAANLAGTSLTLDSDNTGTAVDVTIYANRGSSGTNASFGWKETDQIWNFAETVYSNGAIIGGSYIATNGNNIIFNNDDGTAADCFLQVKRGPSPDVNIKWNESTTRWQTTTDGTNYLNIPNQNLDTNSDVTFASVTVDGGHTIIDTTTTTTTSTSATAITTTSNDTTRSSKFQIQVTDNVTGNIHVLEALVFFQGTTAYLTTYAEMYNSTSLATFTADVNSGNTRLLATPASTNSTTFKVTRISVAL